MTDYTLQVRKAVVSHLKGFAPLTALVAASRIYGEQPEVNPVWPFIRYDSTTLAYEATCWSGSQHLVNVHVFANGPYTDAVLNAAAQVVQAMATWTPPMGTGVVDCEWVGNIGPLRDSPESESAKYHVAVQFNLTVAG